MGNLGEYRDAIMDQVPGNFDILPPLAMDRCITKALAEHSKHRPRVVVEDEAGAGGFAYPLADDLADWEDDFSQVLQVEFPVDDTSDSKDILEPEDWQVYPAPGGKKLHFLSARPATGQSMRITYTARHACTASTSTVPTADECAVQALAAAYYCRALAAAYSQDQDSTIAADQIDQGAKRRNYEAQAKAYEAEYYNHMGIKQGGPRPASLNQDMDLNYQGGGDRLTHSRRYR
jgi:hypothetical protein